ncbi:MAG: type I-MYXAN CRISPR-associated protein Cas6/Cmx6 [Gammaproteobacteria bacterium]|nr:MAG: type I-MYXAN CRISPR-associated protein Cas6/Cmx6 [Gammaproteobacteria bacterium]
MYWQEQKQTDSLVAPDDIVDVSFAIECKTLPVDHAHSLSQAIQNELPWLPQTKSAGIHQIHVANSQNGWMRPEKPDDLLYLSRRTRMVLRLPKERVEDAMALTGKVLDIGGNNLKVKAGTIMPLTTLTILFSRYIVADIEQSEAAFMDDIAQALRTLNIEPRKMLCGTRNEIHTPGKAINTRSLMIADLTVDESIVLQQHGLGPERLLGCGIFIPHKDIKTLRPDDD